MIVFKESKLYSLNGDEVSAVAVSVDGTFPSVGFARNFILAGLSITLSECSGLMDELLENGWISPEQAEEGRHASDAQVELLEATIEKVEALSEIDCTYLLGLVTGFMAGTGERALGEQWDDGRFAAADLNC